MKKIYKLSLGLVLLLIVSIFFLKYALSYLLPFVIAVIVASLIDPVVELFEQRANLPRGLSIVIVLSIIIIFISLILTISFSRLFVELNNLLNNLPDYQSFGKQLDWISERNQQLSRVIEELEIPESFKESINNNFQYFYDKIKEFIQLTSSNLLGIVKKLPNFATVLLISLIATFFISRDKELIVEALLKPFPNKWRHKIEQVQRDIMKAGIGFIRAQMLLITITTLISIIGLSILGSSYSIVVGLTGGLLDFIPVIGPSLIFVPWAIYNLIVGNVSFAIGLFILYGIMGATRQILEAKIVGRSIGIHPLAILVAMYLGVQLLGIAGFFIGPASLVVLKAVFQAGFISIIID